MKTEYKVDEIAMKFDRVRHRLVLRPSKIEQLNESIKKSEIEDLRRMNVNETVFVTEGELMSARKVHLKLSEKKSLHLFDFYEKVDSRCNQLIRILENEERLIDIVTYYVSKQNILKSICSFDVERDIINAINESIKLLQNPFIDENYEIDQDYEVSLKRVLYAMGLDYT